jgi:hypothetical protein
VALHICILCHDFTEHIMVYLQGLCGTFNQNQNDDFLTPEGDIEQDVVAFANKWKTHEVCEDVPEGETPSHPCDVNAHNRAIAEKHCSKLKGLLFEGTFGGWIRYSYSF